MVSSDDKAADDTVDKPAVKKAAPRKTAKKPLPKETSTAKAALELTDGDQAASCRAGDIQPADQLPHLMRNPASPESAEAAADKETPTDSRRRMTVRPNQRRVR